ncbi:hypothetical protein Hanom_Chr05g00419501 [Helianthus anomalus]
MPKAWNISHHMNPNRYRYHLKRNHHLCTQQSGKTKQYRVASYCILVTWISIHFLPLFI